MSRNMRFKKQTVNTGSAKKKRNISIWNRSDKEEDERHRRKRLPMVQKKRFKEKYIQQRVSGKNKPTK